MSYERLELIDGIDKWDVAKVQHLEDAIIKNENDIEKYHNDSVVEIQADWDQRDETAKDYVKNRPCYIQGAQVINVYEGVSNSHWVYLPEINLQEWTKGRLTINGQSEDFFVHSKKDSVYYDHYIYYGETKIGTISKRWDGFYDTILNINESEIYDSTYSIILERLEDEKIKQLDPRLIPVTTHGDIPVKYHKPTLSLQFEDTIYTNHDSVFNNTSNIRITINGIVKTYEVKSYTRRPDLHDEGDAYRYRTTWYFGDSNFCYGETIVTDYQDNSEGVKTSLRIYDGSLVAPYDVNIEFIENFETVKQLDEKYIPDTIARAPKAELDYVSESPTAEQYNALLDVLRQAGILI